MKRIGMMLVGALLGAAGAIAGTPASSETVYLPRYPGISGWKKVTDNANADVKFVEWIPEGESTEDVHDILVEQVYFNLKSVPPAAFAARLIGADRALCDKAATNGPKQATEHGFAVAYAQHYCVRYHKTNRDIDGFIKVIAGRDALYVVMRELHYPTSPDSFPGARAFPKGHEDEAKADMAAHFAAARYLDAVQLCPAADDSPCPTAESSAAEGAIPR